MHSLATILLLIFIKETDEAKELQWDSKCIIVRSTFVIPISKKLQGI